MARGSIAFQFHELTKYAPETIGQGHEIDWAHPPGQFKEYPGAERVELMPFLPLGREDHFKQALASLKDPDGPLGLPSLSRLLFFTNGATAIARGQGQEQIFRAAPSAGALYPTELYVLARGQADMPDGVFNYNVRRHALIEVYPRGLGPEGELFNRLSSACFNHPALKDCRLAIIATSVYWRSAWRYGPRGFRRCMLDTGHVLGNLDIVAPRLGLAALAIGGFVDDEVAELLDIPHGDEGVLAVYALHERGRFAELGRGVAALPSDPYADAFLPEPKKLLKGMHDATCILRADADSIRVTAGGDAGPPEADRFATASTVKLAPSGLDLAADLENTILRRRSTRALTGEGLKFRELSDLLTFAGGAHLQPPEDAQPRLFTPDLLETYIAVHDVSDVVPGVYYYAPRYGELRLIKQGVFRGETFHIALGQELARDAAAVVIHTTDLASALTRFGNRAYRYVHLDAGHVGQRLNLGAIKLGLGVSGIGGFFDDEVGHLIGAGDNELCVYITCLGRPA